MSKGGEQGETVAQRAAANHAANLLVDYKKRWLPVQQRLGQQIQAMGAPDSAARRGAAGRASTDNAIAFSKAQGAVESRLAAQGAAPGSGRAIAAGEGLNEDAATSRGLGMMVADQHIDDAYLAGLGALAATGRGERAAVGDSMGRIAAQSGAQARADAEASALRRAGNAEVVGQLAGYGLQQAFKAPTPQGPGMGRTVLGAQADGFTTNPQAGI